MPANWIKTKLQIRPQRRVSLHFCSLVCIQNFDAPAFINSLNGQERGEAVPA